MPNGLNVKNDYEKRRLNRRIKAGQRPPTYRIIPDTNIWYLLGRDNDVFEKVKDKTICPNYVNITELSNTGNLVKRRFYKKCHS